MHQPEFTSTVARKEWDSLRLKLEAASSGYHVATALYGKILEEHGYGANLPNGISDALVQALHAESEALAEYTRVLQMFIGLITSRKLPEGEPQPVPNRQPAVPEESSIVIVDDDQSIREALKSLLRSAGYRVRTFASAESLPELGQLGDVDCMILDIRMPGMNGLELQRRLSVDGRHIPVIFMTAQDDAVMRRQAIEAGAVILLRKPFAASELLAAVQTAGQGSSMAKTR